MKLPSGGLGLSNAKIARLLLPGAPVDLFHGIGYAVLLHRRVSYPTSEGPSNQAVPLSVCDSEKLAGNDRENIGGRKCQTLQCYGRFIPVYQRAGGRSEDCGVVENKTGKLVRYRFAIAEALEIDDDGVT